MTKLTYVLGRCSKIQNLLKPTRWKKKSSCKTPYFNPMWRTSSLNESMLERGVSVVSCFNREPLEPIRNESCFVNVFNRFIKKDPTHMNDSFTNRTCICCHLSSADMFQQVLYQNILTFCTWINDKYATNYKFNFSYWSLFWNATTSVKEM